MHPVILVKNVARDYFVSKVLLSLVRALQSVLFLCLNLGASTL